jgi:hypothetical protein
MKTPGVARIIFVSSSPRHALVAAGGCSNQNNALKKSFLRHFAQEQATRQ